MLYTPDYRKATPEAISLRPIVRTTKTGAENAALAARIKDNGLPLCDFSVSKADRALGRHIPDRDGKPQAFILVKPISKSIAGS